jgi:hypothetical protein
MYKCFLIVCLLFAFVFAAKAQKPDTLIKNKGDKVSQSKIDSVKNNPIVPKLKEKVYHPDSNHSPHKALIRSMLIPGWGQVYNHQWWKVPIIYTGLGLLASVYIFNQTNYTENLAIAKFYEHGTSPAPGTKYYALYQQYQSYGINATEVDQAVAGYKRNLDLGIFGFIGAWGINMIDAYIDAKFQHSYTMDSNLSLKITPGFLNQPGYVTNFNGSLIPGLKLTFTLK